MMWFGVFWIVVLIICLFLIKMKVIDFAFLKGLFSFKTDVPAGKLFLVTTLDLLVFALLVVILGIVFSEFSVLFDILILIAGFALFKKIEKIVFKKSKLEYMLIPCFIIIIVASGFFFYSDNTCNNFECISSLFISSFIIRYIVGIFSVNMAYEGMNFIVKKGRKKKVKINPLLVLAVSLLNLVAIFVLSGLFNIFCGPLFVFVVFVLEFAALYLYFNLLKWFEKRLLKNTYIATTFIPFIITTTLYLILKNNFKQNDYELYELFETIWRFPLYLFMFDVIYNWKNILKNIKKRT